MTPRLSGDDDTVYACPECDVAGEVWERTHPTRDYAHDCKCHKCGAEFDDPIERTPKTSPVGTSDPPSNETDDGLPASLDGDAKEMIRTIRGP